MNRLADHLMIAPVVLPLFAGAMMLALGGERRRNVNAALNVVTTFALVAIAIALLREADAAPTGVAGVYRLGDWPAPFAIVLVAGSAGRPHAAPDQSPRGSRGCILAGSLAPRGGAFPSSVSVPADGDQRCVPHRRSVQPLRFLRGAARGFVRPWRCTARDPARVMAGLHYIVVNLAASLLFLIGVSLIYGVSGTLNMADLAARIPAIRAEDRALLEAGAGILGIAFLVKAGMWPLCFWLPATYAAAPPPVASIFAILTKVGAYIVLAAMAALVRRRGGSIGSIRRRMVAGWRNGNRRVRRDREPCFAGHGAARGLLGACVVRHGARRHRHGAGRL